MVAGVKIADRKLKRIVNKSLRIERLLKDGFSMGSGGKGRRKKTKDTRMTRYEERYNKHSPSMVLESLLGILAMCE
jgi:hypothetical protein